MVANVLLSPSTGGGGGDPTDPEAIARVLLEKSSLLIYITDLNYKVVLFNRAAREATGYDTASCPNVSAMLERFYPDPGYRSIVQGIHDGWAKNEHIRGTELVVQCKDGSQRTISWSTSRLKVGRRSSTGYIAIGIDVTTRRSLEQWVSLLQRSLQHLTEGVVLTDPAGHILAWSEGANRLLGHAESAMQGRPLADLYLRAERAIIARSVERSIEADGRFAGELELEKADGVSRIVGFQQVRLDGDGGLPLALLTVLSEPEAAGGRAPAEALTELEGKIAQLTSALAGEQASSAEQIALVAKLQADATAAAGAPPAQNTEQAARIATLEDAVAAATAKVAALEADAAAKAVAAGAAAGAADEAGIAAEKAASDAGQEAASQKGRADQAEAALNISKKVAADAAAKADAAVAESASAAAAADQATKQLAAAQAALDEQTKRADRLEGRIQAADLVAQSASGKVDAAEAKASKAASDVKKAKADADKANAAVAEAEAAAASLQEKLAELEGRSADDKASATNAITAAEDRAAAAAKELEEAQAAAAEAQSADAAARGAREEAHRAALKEMQERAAAERKTLEEQLSTDILAAEERAETERAKLEARFAHEKAELEQAAVIARAEAESEWRDRVAALETNLARVPSLQGFLTQVASEAFVAADAEGRIVGWSAGAARLDGKSDTKAIGKHLHKDVLRLEGVDWKKLFGKVVVAGRVEGDYTLVSGSKQSAVKLIATLVRDADGRIQGVAESLRPLKPEGGLDLHGRAAFARVAAPLYKTIEDRVTSGLAIHRRTASATQELLQVAKGVASGASAADLEALARDLDLEGLIQAGPEGISEGDKAWTGLRSAVQDLTRITTGVAEGGTLQVRWNELVERCLSIVENGSEAPKPAERVFGDRIAAEVRGEFVVPLLLALFSSPTPGGKTPAVATSAEGDTVRIDSRGPTPTAETSILLRALAQAAGATLTLAHDGKAATAVLVVPRYPVVEATAVDADGSEEEELIELELEAVPDDDDGEPTSVGRLDLPEIDVELVEEDASSAVLASGSATRVEEDDGGDLLLMLGEDSAVLRKAPASEVEYVPVSATGSHPRVAGAIENTDAELEGAFAGDPTVSASVRDAADAMDAFAAQKSGTDSSNLQADPMPGAPGPSPDVLHEMQGTDSGEKAKTKKARGKKKKKSKSKK